MPSNRNTLAWTLCAVGSLAAAGFVIAQDEPVSSDPIDDAAEYLAPEKPGLDIGDTAPDLVLKNVKGEEVKLSDLWKKQPVILNFYRGGWCPFCNKALTNWENALDDVNAAGATFVAITPEKPQYITATAEKQKLTFLMLSDADGQAQRAYKVQFTLDEPTQKKYKEYGIDLAQQNADGTWNLPSPATFVIDTSGIIRYVFATWDYKERATPADVLDAVNALQAAEEEVGD